MEHIDSGQYAKESRDTDSDPLAVVQLKVGSMNLETSARVHVTFREEKTHRLLMD